MPYPEQTQVLTDLVLENHLKIEDEPLLVAIYFESKLAPNEECLFEVADNVGFNEVSEDKEIFEIDFARNPNLPIPDDRYLRILLTNPTEFQDAVKGKWRHILDLQDAIKRKQYTLLYKRSNDMETAQILDMLHLKLEAA